MARPRQFSDEEILLAARRCFLEHGAQVSTAHIAREIGLSQAALFKRFQTKENLLIQSLAPPEEPAWIHLMVQGPDARPIDEQLVGIGLEAIRFLRTLMPRIMVLKSAGIEPTEMLSRYDVPPPVRAMQLLVQFVSQAQAQGRIELVSAPAFAMQFMGALHGRAYFAHMFDHSPPSAGDDEAYIRAVVATLWKGIAPVETP